ncbi:MAG: hypothetical protein ACOYPS_12525 [Phycisphaerales bacterium]
MNPHMRNVMAHGLIAAAILVGSYMLVVDRLQGKLRASRQESARLAKQVAESEGFRDLVPAMTQSLNRVEAEAEVIRKASDVSRDDRALYAAVMDMAQRHSVRLDEVNPATPTKTPNADRPVTPPGAPPAPPAGPDVRRIEKALAYTVIASGTYGDMVAFLRGVQQDLGYSVIRTVNITAQPDGSGTVRATLSTEHYAFDVTPKVVAAEEGGK